MNEEYLRKKLDKVIHDAVFDPQVNEIMLNTDGLLWIEKQNELNCIPERITSHHAMVIAQSIANYAGLFINESNPSIICSLPFNNARVSISIPPMSPGVAFNIRKHCLQKLSLQDYENSAVISQSQNHYLKNAIINYKNILVSGGPGSGKTTFTNSLLKQIAEDMPYGHRVLILEDISELQCSVENQLSLRTSPARDMRELLKHALRSRPNAIVIGEIVDGAVLDLLKAWNVGCPGGLATIHANSAKATLQRVEDLALEICVTPPRNLIGEAVDVIVHLAADRNHPAGRVVTEILEVKTFNQLSNEYSYKTIH